MSHALIAFSCSAFALLLGSAPAQTFLRDINSQRAPFDPVGSSPAGFARFGSRVVFVAADLALGPRLWITDGTTAGTYALTAPALDRRFEAEGFFEHQGWLYFRGFTTSHGSELWRTDGTPQGTDLFADLEPGIGGAAPSDFASLGNALVFSASRSTTGSEPWITDGTAAGTRMIRDLTGTAAGSQPSSYTRAGNVLVFSAIGAGDSGPELYQTDGTANGTTRLLDIMLGAPGSFPRWFAELSGVAYFSAVDALYGSELWRTDGTPAGTMQVADLEPSSGNSSPSFLTVAGTHLFFSAQTVTLGSELWVSDGTRAGTRLVLDAVPGSEGSAPQDLIAFGSRVLFTAADANSGRELWISDGTASGTQRISDVWPGPVSSDPQSITVVGSIAYFHARGLLERELWRTDGTPSGTYQVIDLHPGFLPGVQERSRMSGTPTRVLFAGEDGMTGKEPFVSDGTAAGTTLLVDIQREVPASSPRSFSGEDGFALFAADDGFHGIEPWISDGTAAGTQLLRDIWPGLPSSNAGPFVRFGAHWYFAAGDPAHGVELWRTDGTSAGTTLFKDLVPGASSGSPLELTVVDDRLFFAAAPNDLWVSDGSLAGTRALRSFPLLPPSSSTPVPIREFTAYRGELWFSAFEAINGEEVWHSNGTPAGTALFFDLNPGPNGSSPRELTVFRDKLFFAAWNPISGGELFYTDGTFFGSGVLDLYPGALPSFPNDLTVVGDHLYCLTQTSGPPYSELWKSNGTAAGTQRLGTGAGLVRGLHAAGDRLFFHAQDQDGREPWVSDGTVAGSRRLGDLNAGPASSVGARDEFTSVGSGRHVLFACDDGVFGRELWISDGTSAGTRRLVDVAPGSAPSEPREMARVGSSVYFSADDGVHGREPWIVSLAALGATLAEPYGSGCAGTGGSAPRLAPRGVPRLGNLSFGFALENARPSAAALGLFSLQRRVLALGLCELLVDAPLLMSLPATLDAQGRALLVTPLAQDPVFLGAEVFVQWLVADPAGYLGAVALTNGLHVLVGT